VRFPFFTFLVNVVGSIGLAFTAISIELRDYNANSDLAGYVLKAFEVGFFGSYQISRTHTQRGGNLISHDSQAP